MWAAPGGASEPDVGYWPDKRQEEPSMCGRMTQVTDPAEVARIFDAEARIGADDGGRRRATTWRPRSR